MGAAGIEEEVGGLDTLGNRNELHTEGLGFLIEARHGKEDAIGGVQVRAIRENYAGIPVTKGDFEGRDQLSGIDKVGDLGFGEQEGNCIRRVPVSPKRSKGFCCQGQLRESKI